MNIPITLKNDYLDRMTEDEFFVFCQDHRDLRIERSRNLEIHIMSPTGGTTGLLEMEISGQLRDWYKETKQGKVFGSSTGFRLPDKSMWAPDAAWVSQEKWDALTTESKSKFPPIAPEFVIELRSPSDPLTRLQKKMHGWIDNGVRLGWLIDPWAGTYAIYRADGSVEVVEEFSGTLSGEDVVVGFELDLDVLREILEG